MLLTKYTPHCNILITHDYYRDGWSRDFDLQATPSTVKSWRGLDCLARKTAKGLSIYYPTNGADLDPKREVNRPVKWQLVLQQQQANFMTFTDLDFTLNLNLGKPFLYCSNYNIQTGSVDDQVDSANNTLLTRQPVASNEDVIGLVGTSFWTPYDPAQHNRIEIWRLWPDVPAEMIVEVNNLSVSTHQSRISVPASTQGLHEVRWTGNSSQQALIYIDTDLVRSGNPLGIVEIFRNPPVDYSRTINYYLEFVRKSAIWRYYVVNNQASINSSDLSVDFSGLPASAYPAVIQFDQIVDSNQTDIERQTTAAISDQEVTLFRSDQPLPYYELPLSGLELRLNGGSPRTLITNLPNPSVQQLLPNLFIQL